MREICSYGSVGERGGNEPLYPEKGKQTGFPFLFVETKTWFNGDKISF
ncbi:MAG TPA: hypothetical protein VKA34_06340 [Balneolales bacterium]|nr:hypothetical protein [Balneolales bacterium]